MVLGGPTSDAARAFSVVAKGLGVPVYWIRGESTGFKEIAEVVFIPSHFRSFNL